MDSGSISFISGGVVLQLKTSTTGVTFGPLSINNFLIGFEHQYGDAWNRNNNPEFKKSYGAHIRLSGYSFYNYPTAIGLEFHRPSNQFNVNIDNSSDILYGNDDRMYFNILFGF